MAWTYLSVSIKCLMRSTSFVHLLLFTYESALLSPMISLRQLHKLYCNPVSKLQFSFCPGPVAQTDWTGIYGGFFRWVREQCSKIYNKSRLINCQTETKIPETFPWGLAWRLEWCKIPASSIMWFCIKDRRILLKTCQAPSFDVLLFDPPVALQVKNFFSDLRYMYAQDFYLHLSLFQHCL